MVKNLEKNIIKFEDNSILRIMFGVFHKNLEIIEKKLNVILAPRGNIISINGNVKNILVTKNTLSELYERAKVSEIIEKKDVESIIQNMKENKKNNNSSEISIKTPKKEIWPRTNGQIKFQLNYLRQKIRGKEILRDYQLKLESNFMMDFGEDIYPSDLYHKMGDIFTIKIEVDKFVHTIQGIAHRLRQ